MAGGMRCALAWRGVKTLCAAFGAAGVTACTSKEPVQPVIPQYVPVAQFAPLAFTADVNLRTGDITIASPTAAGPGVPVLSLDVPREPSLSLLGADAVRLISSNYHASEVGAFAPNKIRVSFDVVIENRLPYVALTTPTWPAPPAPGVIVFPLDYVITATPGDAVGDDGDSVVVEAPLTGAITPSVDWNGTGAVGSGSPFSFFNDIGCTQATTTECFRWSAFDLSVAPGTRSSKRTVGFDVDASATQFRARLIVAADLKSATLLAPAQISGTVFSTQGVALGDVRVTATTGQTLMTDAGGAFLLVGLTPGQVTVSLSGLPAECASAPPQTLLVADGAHMIADFLVRCELPFGTITGTLTSSDGGAPIGGASVTTSTGGSSITSVAGAFTITSVTAGPGSVSATGLFAGCSIASTPYTLPAGGSVSLSLIATCTSVPNPGPE